MPAAPAKETLDPLWVVRLRWGAVASQAGAALLARLLFDVPLVLTPLLVLIGLAAVSNGILQSRVPDLSERTLGAVLLFDTANLGAMLAVSGGPANPFSILFLVYVTLSAVLLRPGWTWAITAASILCFGAQFVWHLPVPELAGHGMAVHGGQAAHAGHDMGGHAMHGGGGGGFSAHLYGMMVAFAVAAVLIAFFVSRTSASLRARDQELSRARGREQRLASLTALAGGAAHELGSPLGTIAVVAKELQRALQEAGANEALVGDAELVRQEVARCREILGRMSEDAGEFAGEALCRVPARQLAEDAVVQLGERAVRVQLDVRSEAALDVPPRAFVGALVNLLRNALDASDTSVQVRLQVLDAADGVRFEVQDRGHGMDAAVRERAVEPFYTTKEPGRGMGLGLFLVDTLMQRLGGKLAIDSEPGSGTRCTLELPR